MMNLVPIDYDNGSDGGCQLVGKSSIYDEKKLEVKYTELREYLTHLATRSDHAHA